MSAPNRVFQILCAATALAASASVLSAAISLNANTSPTNATVGQSVTVSGTGFPAGSMPNASVGVTVTCPQGNGGAITVNSNTVFTLASSRIISFTIPAALTVNQPVTCQVTVSGSLPSAYSSGAVSSTIVLNPPATVSTVSPGAGTRGTVVNNVQIVGRYTHFKAIQPAQPTVTVGGTGVTVSNVNASNDTHLTVTLTLDPAAVSGLRSVTVKTGSEVASTAGGFLVAVNPSLSVGISPATGAQGTTFDVNVTGINTTFTQGTTLASFGDSVRVNSVTIVNPLSATVNVTVDPLAPLGARNFTITTGGEYGLLSGGFVVTLSTASLTSVLPAGGAQGTSATIAFTGSQTHWVPAGSLVSFGGGIVVGNVSVSGNTSLTANISVPALTPAGSYAATVTTNGEVVTLPNAFTVTAATPFLSGVAPTAGNQGQTLDVNLTGTFTSFLTGTPTANFGPNITVNSILVTDNTHLKINIGILNTAFAGGRTASLTSNGTIFNFNFTVNSSLASITGLNPASGLQGASVSIQVTGANTHWVDGLTQASLDPVYITINRVKVTSATTAQVDISIAINAPIGGRTLTLSTGGEIVTASPFTVLAFTPTMTMNPSSGMIATSVPVVFSGSFTHWLANTTVANISGQGVSIQGFTVDTPASAHATLVIDPTAPSNPTVSCTPGNRTLTLTTVSGVIDEIDTTPFCVTSSPAYLTSITPTHTAAPVNSLTVDIFGANTHFDNTTTVGFGPDISLAGNVSVINATHLQVVINIAASAALGYRQVFVNSTCAACIPANPEQLTAGFHLDYPATSTLSSISPSAAAQGQSLSNVLITGNLTNWGATTQAIIGAGIQVSNLQIVTANTATADISVSPTTPTGGRNVVMITNAGAEVESGLVFNVTPSIASVSAVGINSDCSQVASCGAPPSTIALINQGDTKSFRLVGVATHFLQGATTLDFGPNISITQVYVVDATHLYGQITAGFNAATGFRNFRAITDGEVAPSFSNSVNVQPVTGTVNITPTSAPQGSTLDITINGVGSTHFKTGDTSATFGNNNGIVGTGSGTSTLSGADVTVNSLSQAVLHVRVQGTAYCCIGGLRDLTVTTQNVVGAPGSVEQINLPLAFLVSQGAAIITQVTPSQDTQGHSVNIQVTGQNTSFVTGVTTAALTTGGCSPASPAGAIVTNVTATDSLHAMLAVAIDVNAATGIRGVCLYTLGEAVGYLNAFNVLPGVPSLNGIGPVSGLQGQTLPNVTLLGNFTHWNARTTFTFGQGITVSNIQVTDNTHAKVDLYIDPISQPGGRTVTATAGTEVVTGNLFTVNPGPAILSSLSTTSANQGQNFLMTVTGQFTHWAQGLTQFSIGGGDITVNGFLIQSATTALADLTVSPTANPGTRTVTMSTGGETVSLIQGFLVTGGIPSVISISPSTYKQCDANVNVQIAGVFTVWTGATTVYMGPNITVNSVTRNSNTALTAVVTVACGAPLGVQNVLVQTGGQGLTGQVQIISNALPTPYISYEYPSVALKGQTLSVSISGAYTNWLPGTTQVTFGAGITVNNFQVTGLTSAVANITIQPSASVGTRNVILTTGAEVETTSFYVTVGTPTISLVDGPNGSNGIQGQTLTVNLVGQYTTWTGATTFSFGAGITLVPASIQIFGPTAARMSVTVDILASLGGRTVIATTGSEVAYGYFGVSPSTANISTVMPNTVMQGTNGFVTHVTGFNTHWINSTSFTFGGGDVGVTSVNVIDATNADVTMNLAPLASPGLRNVTAITGGEVATLVNGFVVTPGTPILTSCVNCTPASNVKQGNNFTASILGQFTAFVAGTTTVTFGNGALIGSINVTGPQSVDVGGLIDPLAYVGCRDVTVTTGAQVLKLYGAFCIGAGPAVISQLNPNTGLQGTTFDVAVTGTNTHFTQNISVGSFGPGISLNTLTVNSFTGATANITIAANATVQQNSINLTTQGESATIPLGFTILSNTPTVSFINPTFSVQGATLDIAVTGNFTNWSLANTTASFGTGIAASVTAVADATHATVHLVISPVAPTGNHAVSMVTNLGGGAQQIAVYTIGNGNGVPGYFAVNSGSATILSAIPTTPATVHQNDQGDIIAITGSGTHFTAANPTINFTCVGAPVAFVVTDDTHINATVNVGTFATTGPCGVTVTTGGEVATGSNLFNVLAGLPVLTSISPTSARQNDTFNITVSGLYTHFTAASTIDLGAGIAMNGAPSGVTNTSATFNVTVNVAAALTARGVTVTTGAETASKVNAFTVLAGLPQITGISIPNGPQGLTQNEHIAGAFTHWTAASVVSVSGTGVTVGNPPSAPDNLNLNVNFTVSVGAPAGLRTVTVTTGAETVQLAGAFNVLPGTPNLSSLSPNIGVPNSTVNVSLTGVFTNFTAGATTANFGPDISVNGFGFGIDGQLTVGNTTTASATLTIKSAAALGAVNVVVTTPAPPLAAPETFTVINGFTIQTTPSVPVITSLSPAMGLSGTASATNVPINTQITVVFNEPMKASTITPANAFITDGTAGVGPWAVSGLPATVQLDLSGRVLTITPTGNLPVGHQFYLQLNSYSVPGGTPTIQDASGTQNLGHYYYNFSTGFAQDSSGPTFITGSIPSGATSVPTNVQPGVQFDKPVNAATIAGLTVVKNPGAVAVPGTWSYSSDLTQYYFAPASALVAATNYTVAYSNVLTDATGHVLTNPGSYSFTTGAGPDTTGNSVTFITPSYNSTVATNALIRFTTAKPLNPLTVNQMYIYNQVTGIYTYGTVVHSADFKTWELQLLAPLDASTYYLLSAYSMYDWAGNCCVSFNSYFHTGAAADNAAPTVLSVSPPAGSTNVPVNSPVWVHFSKVLDQTSVPANAITLNGGAVAGTIAFAAGPDYTTLVFTPTSNLPTSTGYNVAVAGLRDTSGNALAAFAGSSFTTAASASVDTTRGNVTITPTGSAVPVNTTVVFQLDKAVNPISINSLSMRVYDNSLGKDIPGTVAVSANLRTLTFTPATQLPSQHQICTWNGNPGYLYDLAGNQFNYTGICFTTTSAVDLTAPSVLSVSPPDTSVGIGPNNPVVVTFSKPINPGTVNTNVALYTGSTLYTAGYSLSQDSTTVSFSIGNLPYGTQFTVVVTPGVIDLANNHLAAEFRSTFTTAPQPLTTRPSVTSMRPGSGATGVPVNAGVTFFTSAPMNTATVNAASLHVSQNGVLLNGAIAFAASNQAVTFTPASNFAPGSLIEVWLTSAATDTGTNALYDYYGHFTVVPDLSATPLTISNHNCSFCGYTPTNSTIEVVFTKPVNPATVTAASFFAKDTNNVNPVNGIITFFNNNRGIRLTPASPIPLNNYTYVYLSGAIQDTDGLSFAGSAVNNNYYFYTYTAADNTAPFVSGIAPTNGAVSIGSNAGVSITFNKNVDALTLDPANVTLTGPGGVIPVSLSYNTGNFTLSITPQAPLPTGLVSLQLNGVTDYAGNPLNPTPYNSGFTVQNAPDYNAPRVIQSSWTDQQINVPVTSGFSVLFNKPIDLRSVVLNNTVYFWDATLGNQNVPVTLSWSSGNTSLLLTPVSPLSVGHQYRIYINGFGDLNGNVSGNILNQYFNTVLVAPSGGPVITQFVPPAGLTGVPVNFRPQVQFDRPIQASALSGVTLVKTAGALAVPMSAQPGGGGTILTVVPNSLLLPNTQYTVTVAGVSDAAGTPLAAPSSRTFTTGASIDLVVPAVTSVTPLSNATVGTNALLKLTFNKPINPISATSYAVYQYSINRYVNGVNLVWAADLKSVMFSYPGSLNPNDHFYFYLNGFADLAGNSANSGTNYFYTTSSVDSTPLTVTGVNPPAGAIGVPVNPAISLRLSKPVAPTSLTNSSVTLSGVAGTTLSVSADGQTLTMTLPGLLVANTPYTVQVTAGAFTDNNNNAVSAFSSGFTTSASGLSDTSHGGVSLTDPSPGSTGVPLNKVITVTFSKSFNPNSIVSDSLIVCINGNCANRIAGTVAVVDANHLSFTPAVGLPPAATISVFVYPFTTWVTDLAGNNIDSPYLYNVTFGTASTVDNTPPSVTSMTPANGATGVGSLTSVALTFNKSLDQSTVNGTTFALYQGSNNLGAGVSISADRRTVYLSTTLPFSATITVTANTGVKDYAGNSMAAPYSASFATESAPFSFNPSVIQVRPGNGAPLNSKVTIFTNSKINLTSAQNGIQVAQNGALISGTVSLTADQQGMIWTPATNYLPSAFIEVFVTGTVTDQNSNAINGYRFAFTTQAATCAVPAITGYTPGRTSYNNYLLNPAVEVQFCKAIDPATITTSSFDVRVGSSPGSGTQIAGSFSFGSGNTLVRFTPNADLAANQYASVLLTSAIKDLGATAFAGDSYYIYIQPSAVHDNTPLTVSTVTPVAGATGIGDNAPIRIVFSKTIDTLTANSTNVQIGGGGIAYTYTFSTVNSTQTVMNITPLVALPDNATISVHVTNGVKDLTGGACADSPTSFQTGAGADFSGPVLVSRSIDSNSNSGVPTNSTFTMTFSKPLDPSTVAGNLSGNNTCCFFYYDSSAPGGFAYPPSTANLSADLKTVTIIPSSPLTPNIGSMYYYWNGATDLNGNALSAGNQFFSSGAGPSVASPTVIQTTPTSLSTNIPTNVMPEIIFDTSVRATSLGSITLDGSPVAAVLNNGVSTNDTVVRLVPPALLSPGAHAVAVTGVQNVAGNTMAGSFNYAFTVGGNFNVVSPTFLSATVTTNVPATVPLPQNSNVSSVKKTNPVFTFVWDTPIDYASLLAGAVYLTDTSNTHINIPITFTQSPDQMTVTAQVNGTLSGSTQYKMWIYYSVRPLSITGVFDNSQRQFPFTTEP
jgi:hypothetical protein